MTIDSEGTLPLTWGGEVIGRARITSDGQFDIHLNPQSDFVKDLVRVVSEGLCEAVSAAPVIIPTRPRMLDNPKIRIRDFGRSDDAYGSAE